MNAISTEMLVKTRMFIVISRVISHTIITGFGTWKGSVFGIISHEVASLINFKVFAAVTFATSRPNIAFFSFPKFSFCSAVAFDKRRKKYEVLVISYMVRLPKWTHTTAKPLHLLRDISTNVGASGSGVKGSSASGSYLFKEIREKVEVHCWVTWCRVRTIAST